MDFKSKISAIGLSLLMAVGVAFTIIGGNVEHIDAKAAAFESKDGYTKITDLSTLNDDDKVVLYCDDTGEGVTGASNDTDATVSTTEAEWVQYTVEVVDENKYLKVNDGNYIANPGSKNCFKYGTTGGNLIINISDGAIGFGITSKYLYKNGSYYRCYTDKSTSDNYKPFFAYKFVAAETTVSSVVILDSNNQTIPDDEIEMDYGITSYQFYSSVTVSPDKDVYKNVTWSIDQELTTASEGTYSISDDGLLSFIQEDIETLIGVVGTSDVDTSKSSIVWVIIPKLEKIQTYSINADSWVKEYTDSGNSFNTDGLKVFGHFAEGTNIPAQEINETINWSFSKTESGTYDAKPKDYSVGSDQSLFIKGSFGDPVINVGPIEVKINIIEGPLLFTVEKSSFDDVTGTIQEDIIEYESHKGGASTTPAINNGHIRLYQNGGYITISVVDNVKHKIDSVKITTTSTYSTTIAYKVDDNDESQRIDLDKSSIFTTPVGLNANMVTFTCYGTDSDSRLEIGSIEVTYSQEIIKVTSVAIDGEDIFELNPQSTINLGTTVLPTDAYNKTLSWNSSDIQETYISLVDNGDGTATVTANSLTPENTSVTITATSTDGTNLSDSITITVVAAAHELVGVTVGGVLENKEQIVGHDFDPAGLTFTLTHNPIKEPADVLTNDEIKNIVWPDLTEGMTSITGKYNGKDVVVDTSYGLNVVKDYVNYLTFTGTPVIQLVGDPFNPEGLTFTSTTKGGVVTENIDVTKITFNPETLSLGDTKVTATLGLGTVDIPISVEVKPNVEWEAASGQDTNSILAEDVKFNHSGTTGGNLDSTGRGRQYGNKNSGGDVTFTSEQIFKANTLSKIIIGTAAASGGSCAVTISIGGVELGIKSSSSSTLELLTFDGLSAVNDGVLSINIVGTKSAAYIKSIKIYGEFISDQEAVNNFIAQYLFLDPESPDYINPNDSGDTNACRNSGEGAKSLYQNAVDALENLTNTQLLLLKANEEAYARLQAWAEANGQTFSIDDTTGEVTSKAMNKRVLSVVKEKDNLFNFGMILIGVSSITLIGLFAFKKRKVEE